MTPPIFEAQAGGKAKIKFFCYTMKQHTYTLQVRWTGNNGQGTTSYSSYRRDHVIQASGKAAIDASSDPAFRGNPAFYNPEELLVASLSSCHMLWYLHLCAIRSVVVLEYEDEPAGVMHEDADGGGHFVNVDLRPRVTISGGSDPNLATALHEEAHHKCFIARSVKFPVRVTPHIIIRPAAAS